MSKWSIAVNLGNLGNVTYMQGNYPTARSLYEQSLAMQREIGDKWGIAISLAGLGEVATATGQPHKGAGLLGASQIVYEAIGAVMDPEDRMPYERAIASARSQLGEEAFEQARREGRDMSMEQAIEHALREESQ
jgi:hypothetical protein